MDKLTIYDFPALVRSGDTFKYHNGKWSRCDKFGNAIIIDDKHKSCDNEIDSSWGLGPKSQNTEWDYHSIEDKPKNKPFTVIWGNVTVTTEDSGNADEFMRKTNGQINNKTAQEDAEE